VTCTFSPGIVNLLAGIYPKSNPTMVINMTVSTSVPPPTPAGARLLWPGALAGMLVLALGVRRRRGLMGSRWMATLCCVVLGSLALGVTGCGGNGSSSFASPKGTASITLTCSGTGLLGPTIPPAPGLTPPNVPSGNPNLINTSAFSLTVQ
jgi:hypothetical protein